MNQPQQRDGRLRVGVIGAGKVGPILGAALAGAGHSISGISATSESSKDRVQSIMPDAPIRDVPGILANSELVLIAVPDEQLADLVSGLAAAELWQPGQIVVHTSARFGTDVLMPAVVQGAIPIALHPAMRFTGTSIDLIRLGDSYIAVTAPNPVLPIGQALAVELGGEPVVISEEQRADYAEAISIASDFSRAIVDQSTGILAGLGLEQPNRIVAPLIRSTVENALANAAGAASTELSVDSVSDALSGDDL